MPDQHIARVERRQPSRPTPNPLLLPPIAQHHRSKELRTILDCVQLETKDTAVTGIQLVRSVATRSATKSQTRSHPIQLGISLIPFIYTLIYLVFGTGLSQKGTTFTVEVISKFGDHPSLIPLISRSVEYQAVKLSSKSAPGGEGRGIKRMAATDDSANRPKRVRTGTFFYSVILTFVGTNLRV